MCHSMAPAARVWTDVHFVALRASLMRPTVVVHEIKTGAADTAVLSIKGGDGGNAGVKIYKCESAAVGVPQAMANDKVGLFVARCEAVKELPRHVHSALDQGACGMLWGSTSAVMHAVQVLKATFAEKVFRTVDYYIRPAHGDSFARMAQPYTLNKLTLCIVGDGPSFTKPVCIRNGLL